MIRARCCVALLVTALLGCDREQAVREQPSFVVVVLDTVRADAVSAYGSVAGTTPNVDALATRGLRFTNAYAPAPWTLPSHVSLFTGLGPEHHRVAMGDRLVAPAELEMLAERLHDAGYDTAAFIENTLISEPFGMSQGFDHFVARTLSESIAEAEEPGSSKFDVIQAVDTWIKARHSERPFFVFVNLLEAHEPYQVRTRNPFLPAGVSTADAEAVAQSTDRICDAIPPANELAILRGLYLGDVAAADATFGEIHRKVSEAAGKRRLVSIVTADHGEHLGERRLLDHSYSVDNVVLHIPLIVAGLPDVAPAVVKAPVTLMDVTASVLQWAGVDSEARLDGRPLPLSPRSREAERNLLSVYSDHQGSEDWPLDPSIQLGPSDDEMRAACGPKDWVFGEMASVIHYPYKLIWHAQYDAQLFDLETDPGEQNDLAAQQPLVFDTLRAGIEADLRRTNLFGPSSHRVVEGGARETLRALGYGG